MIEWNALWEDLIGVGSACLRMRQFSLAHFWPIRVSLPWLDEEGGEFFRGRGGVIFSKSCHSAHSLYKLTYSSFNLRASRLDLTKWFDCQDLWLWNGTAAPPSHTTFPVWGLPECCMNVRSQSNCGQIVLVQAKHKFTNFTHVKILSVFPSLVFSRTSSGYTICAVRHVTTWGTQTLHQSFFQCSPQHRITALIPPYQALITRGIHRCSVPPPR